MKKYFQLYFFYDLFKEWWVLNRYDKCQNLYHFRSIINYKFEYNITEEIYKWNFDWKGISIIHHDEDISDE